MSIEIKEFDSMVSDVLTRISNSTVISNTNPGSVIRTIVEAILSELDIFYYQLNQQINGMDIDKAVGDYLDKLIKILGVTRKNAIACSANITFGRSSASDVDISIPYGTVISTRADASGNVVEFTVTQQGAKLLAGSLEVDVTCTANIVGILYVPALTVTVMNTPIVNIEYVKNKTNISGGYDEESDTSLRTRAKNALSLLGKGTSIALENAILALIGVDDVRCLDMNRGIGTSDIIVLTSSIPAPQALQDQIMSVINENKSAGIDVGIIYPSIFIVNVTVNTTGFTDVEIIGNSILAYIGSLNLGSQFIINQLERYILNACNILNMDIDVLSPTHNVTPTSTQIIRGGIITINGVVWSNG